MSVIYKVMPDGLIQWGENEFKTYKAQMAYAFADHMILAVTQGHGMGKAMSHETLQPHERPDDTPLMNVDQIVKRACDLAEALYAEMKRREFVMEIPHDGWSRIE